MVHGGAGETLVRWVTLGYLVLPLAIGAIAGLCLLIAALRRSLTGGAALALGALGAIVVLGMLYAGPGHEALAGAVRQHGISERLLALLANAYFVLPLFLAAAAALSLLIATMRKQLDGVSAAGLGGLGAVVVLATVVFIRHHVEQANAPTVAREAQAGGESAPAYVAAEDLEELAAALREEMVELRQRQALLEDRTLAINRLGEQVQRMLERAAALEERTTSLQRGLEQETAARSSLQTRMQELEGALERASAQPAAGAAAQPAPTPASSGGGN